VTACLIENASLNKVSKVDTTATLMGTKTALPIYIAPAALARLGHPGGEVNMVHVAGQEGILQAVSLPNLFLI
jgi:L-lactate dehydrogenase (cytochrome)